MTTPPPDPYPVISTQTLPPAARRRFPLGRKRDPTALPAGGGNRALVFEVGGRFEEFSDGHHLTGTEQPVVDAVSVTVVDKRPNRPLHLEFSLDSADAGQRFVVQVSLEATVTDVKAVAAEQVNDLAGMLDRYFHNDLKLMQAGRSYHLDTYTRCQNDVATRINVTFDVDPPRFRGIDLRLTAVRVMTSAAHMKHLGALVDEQWRQEVVALKSSGARAEAALIEEIMRRGPEAIAALSRVWGELGGRDLTELSLKRTEQREDRLQSVYAALLASGHFDHARIPTQEIIDALVSAVGVEPAPSRPVTSPGEPILSSRDDRRRQQLADNYDDLEDVDDPQSLDEDDVGV